MAHFAKIDNSGVVIFVTVGRDEDNEIELSERTGDTYKKTSYNTVGGIHYDPITRQPSEDQSKAFRKNFAGKGCTYDAERDAFISPKPYSSWELNESKCTWEAPIPYPEDGKNIDDRKVYDWDEEAVSWVEIK